MLGPAERIAHGSGAVGTGVGQQGIGDLEEGDAVRFTDAPGLDQDDPQARLLTQVQGVIAEYERAKIGERKRWYDVPEEVAGGPLVLLDSAARREYFSSRGAHLLRDRRARVGDLLAKVPEQRPALRR